MRQMRSGDAIDGETEREQTNGSDEVTDVALMIIDWLHVRGFHDTGSVSSRLVFVTGDVAVNAAERPSSPWFDASSTSHPAGVGEFS